MSHLQRPNTHAARNLGFYHLHPTSENCMSVPSMHHHYPIQLSKFAPQLQPCAISPENGFQDSCFTSIQRTSQFHRNRENNISTTVRCHFKPIQVSRCASRIHPSPASPAPRSHDYCLTSIHVQFHFHSRHYIRILPQTMSRLTPNQVPIFVIHLHPGHVSPKCGILEWHFRSLLHRTYWRSRVVHLNSIQVPSQTHTGLEIWISPQSRLPDSCVLPIQIVFHINEGTNICISHPYS